MSCDCRLLKRTSRQDCAFTIPLKRSNQKQRKRGPSRPSFRWSETRFDGFALQLEAMLFGTLMNYASAQRGNRSLQAKQTQTQTSDESYRRVLATLSVFLWA